MPIVPDTKNWTWVLEKPCPECGFDAATVGRDDIPALLRANAAEWPGVLRRADVRDRPDDATWSPLEYSAHVRDVFRVMLGRLRLILEEDDPLFPNWDQDATAIAERYGEQDPLVVSEELLASARELIDAYAAVQPEAWSRTGRRTDGAVFSVESLGRYLVHDPVHHLWDVNRGL